MTTKYARPSTSNFQAIGTILGLTFLSPRNTTTTSRYLPLFPGSGTVTVPLPVSLTSQSTVIFLSKCKANNGSDDELSWPLAAFASGPVCLAAFGEDRQRPADGTSGRCCGSLSFAVRRTN